MIDFERCHAVGERTLYRHSQFLLILSMINHWKLDCSTFHCPPLQAFINLCNPIGNEKGGKVSRNMLPLPSLEQRVCEQCSTRDGPFSRGKTSAVALICHVCKQSGPPSTHEALGLSIPPTSSTQTVKCSDFGCNIRHTNSARRAEHNRSAHLSRWVVDGGWQCPICAKVITSIKGILLH